MVIPTVQLACSDLGEGTKVSHKCHPRGSIHRAQVWVSAKIHHGLAQHVTGIAVSPEIQNAAAVSRRVARTDRKPAGDRISAK